MSPPAQKAMRAVAWSLTLNGGGGVAGGGNSGGMGGVVGGAGGDGGGLGGGGHGRGAQHEPQPPLQFGQFEQ